MKNDQFIEIETLENKKIRELLNRGDEFICAIYKESWNESEQKLENFSFDNISLSDISMFRLICHYKRIKIEPIEANKQKNNIEEIVLNDYDYFRVVFPYNYKKNNNTDIISPIP